MKKAWSIIVVIVLVAILLGAVSVGVGFLTGAEPDRIMSVLEAHFGIDLKAFINSWYVYLTHDIPQLLGDVFNAVFFPDELTSTVVVVG